jgi:hypothetical protein
LTGVTVPGNNSVGVIRTPAIFLLNVFFVLGPGLFERAHLAEVQRELGGIPVPKLARTLPLKRLPEKRPAHDPATCAICIAIYAPAIAAVGHVPVIGLLAPVGWVAADQAFAVIPIRVAVEQCRGPPVG